MAPTTDFSINSPTGQPDQIPQLLKIEQVATILQISRTSAYRLAQTGELPAVRFGGGTVRVRLDDLTAFIEGSRLAGAG
jgi:excisionase family DNA binding protein